jgi:choline dehydrogenase-like flavoprotein
VAVVNWTVTAYLGAHDIRAFVESMPYTELGGQMYLGGDSFPLTSIVNTTLDATWTYVRSLVGAPLSWVFVSTTITGITTGNFQSATATLIRTNTQTVIRAIYTRGLTRFAGSARMGLSTDPSAVVDAEFRVLGGVSRLRICDASVLPRPFLQHGIEAEAALAAVCARKIAGTQSSTPRTNPVCGRAPLSLDERALGTFDFVVVGSGSSGCATANRLSETNATVLLLERGLAIPLNESSQTQRWFETATAHVRSMFAPDRQRDLLPDPNSLAGQPTNQAAFGGTTGVEHGNLIATVSPSLDPLYGAVVSTAIPSHMRPDRKHLQQWLTGFGITNWSWDDVLPFMRRWERYFDPEFCANATLTNTIFGCNGSMVLLPQENAPVINAGGSFGARKIATGWKRPSSDSMDAITRWLARADISFSSDAEVGFDGDLLNRAWIKHMFFSNVIDSWFPAAMKTERASNLFIELGVSVGRIHFAATSSPGPLKQQATHVELLDGRVFKVRRDVIVSAGGVTTPQVLQASGIGSASLLRGIGIRSVVPLNGVGRNYMDHARGLASPQLRCTNTGVSLNVSNVLTLGYRSTFRASIASGSDGSTTVPNMNMRLELTISPGAGNATSTAQLRHRETYFETSRRGKVESVSGDVMVPPRLFDAYDLFEKDGAPNAGDLATYIAQYRFYQRVFANTSAADLFPNAPTASCSTVAPTGYTLSTNVSLTDADIAALILPFLDTTSINFNENVHYHGTARMGVESDPLAVVDNRCKVFGTSNLRVVDGTITPRFMHGHFLTTAYTIAEKCSQHIKDDHGLIDVHPSTNGPDVPPLPFNTPIVGLATDAAPSEFNDEL